MSVFRMGLPVAFKHLGERGQTALEFARALSQDMQFARNLAHLPIQIS
jgi:hypothetical protein